MNLEQIARLKAIRELVISRYQSTLAKLKRVNTSMYMSAKALEKEYMLTLNALEKEQADHKAGIGHYSIIKNEELQIVKLEQSMNSIASKFIVKIYPIFSGEFEAALDMAYAAETAQTNAINQVVEFVKNGGAIADFSPEFEL